MSFSASGVVPASLPSTKTRAPGGRESTTSAPTKSPFVADGAGGVRAADAVFVEAGRSSGTVNDCDGFAAVMTTRRSTDA